MSKCRSHSSNALCTTDVIKRFLSHNRSYPMARVASENSRSFSPSGTSNCDSSMNWDSGFFDVCALGFLEMCQTHFCPCITYAQNERMLKLREDPETQSSPWLYAHRAPFYACLLCCGAHCFLHQRYRLRIRALYDIKNGPYGDNGDFLLSWCPKDAHTPSLVAVVFIFATMPVVTAIAASEPQPQVFPMLRADPREAYA
jgi:hypothetical protein